ncbi:M48 family metalloprotease [Streptomyces asoensis]|uniref:M48 family metalloprotease n=1 Tax=Streptomyces asoensis TaxID=249586 RepID=UPI0033F576CB
MTHPVDPRLPQDPYGYGGPIRPVDQTGQAGQPQNPAYPPGPPAPPGPPHQAPYQAPQPQQPYQAGPAEPQYQQPPYQPAPAPQPPYQQQPHHPTAQPVQFAPGQQPPHAPQQAFYGQHQPPYAQQPAQQSFAPQQQPHQAPDQAPQLSYPQQPAQYAPHEPGTPRVNRGADASSVTTLLLNVPLFLGSLLIIWLISRAMPHGVDIAFVIAWLASGALVFHRPTERGLARLWFKMRPPTRTELAVIQPIWDDITRRAGIDGAKYDLWVEDTDGLNASAAAGHIVSVTRGATRQLPPAQLSAVMAHELGHHVGGHAWSGLLGFWYAMPVRLFMFVVKIVMTFLFFFTAELSCVAAGIFVLIFGGLAVATFLTFPPAAALFAIPFLLAWAGRQGELRADRFAGRLGYGPLLISVFTVWQDEGHDDTVRKQSPVARLMSTHPPLHQRIRALETFVA